LDEKKSVRGGKTVQGKKEEQNLRTPKEVRAYHFHSSKNWPRKREEVLGGRGCRSRLEGKLVVIFRKPGHRETIRTGEVREGGVNIVCR